MDPLAAEFERAVRQDVEHVRKVSSYRPSFYLQMLANDGAVATVQKLVLAGFELLTLARPLSKSGFTHAPHSPAALQALTGADRRRSDAVLR